VTEGFREPPRPNTRAKKSGKISRTSLDSFRIHPSQQRSRRHETLPRIAEMRCSRRPLTERNVDFSPPREHPGEWSCEACGCSWQGAITMAKKKKKAAKKVAKKKKGHG
jgi:hypothetical protein